MSFKKLKTFKKSQPKKVVPQIKISPHEMAKLIKT